MSSPIRVAGMHGLGDNLHQRAIVRQMMTRHDVYLESSWCSPYHDLIAAGLKVVEKRTPLRVQTENARRESALFYRGEIPSYALRSLVSYSPALVRKSGSVLAAMCATANCDYASADFSLPIAPAWRHASLRLLDRLQPTRPILIYRPLVDRPKDWGGCGARNPDFDAYAALFAAIRERFFVVSIADLVPGYEWAVGHTVDVDASFHRRELEFEDLAGLISLSAMVYASPGFAIVLAQAVGTPAVCVFGGYERAYSFAAGARVSPYLGIEPIRPCDCFRHDHACSKEIDIAAARSQLLAFAETAARRAITA